jgi:hypothetical protein
MKYLISFQRMKLNNKKCKEMLISFLQWAIPFNMRTLPPPPIEGSGTPMGEERASSWIFLKGSLRDFLIKNVKH